ncbi:MAG: carbonic anhydrase [Nevskiales bacterium]
MPGPKDLLANNRKWATQRRAANPEFFARLAQAQQPDYLWIGCSDARVPANELIGLPPGEVFVQRNLGNQFFPHDFNAVAVLQFAVEVLKVRHVIVCGHYGCGAVNAAMHHAAPGRGLDAVKRWITDIRRTRMRSRKELLRLDPAACRDRLCELNVIQQVEYLRASPAVRGAWARGQKLSVHGWIYHLEDGLLQDLSVTVSGLKDKPLRFAREAKTEAPLRRRAK